MKSFKPIIVATAVATCLFAQDASAAHAQPALSVASTAATDSADATVLIASSDGPTMEEEAVAPAIEGDSATRGARHAAEQGPDALRRFVERTQTIYALQYRDFAQFVR